jgi:hypothetical protein
MSPHTTTKDLQDAYMAKSALLLTWENQPIEVQADNRKHILDLTRRVRQLREQLRHRKDSPI